MKKFRKVMSLVLALALVFGLSATAFAASSPEATGSITINGAIANETYTIYQIFELTYADDTDVSGDWSSYSYKVNDDWADYLENYSIVDSDGNNLKLFILTENNYLDPESPIFAYQDDDEVVAQLARDLLAYAAGEDINGTTVSYTATVANDGTISVQLNPADGTASVSGAYVEDGNVFADLTFNGLSLGYYLVDTSLGSLCMLTSTDPDAVVNEKNSTPVISKHVYNTEDNDWEQEDHEDNGTEVTYELDVEHITGAVNLVIHDSQPSELEEDWDDFHPTVALVDGGSQTRLNEGNDYTIVLTGAASETCSDVAFDEAYGCTFEIDFTGYDFSNVSDEAEIVVIYQAILETEGDIYADDIDEIDNFAVVTFGSNSTSPVVEAEVYSFGFEVFKYTDAADDGLDVITIPVYNDSPAGQEDDLYLALVSEVNGEETVTYFALFSEVEGEENTYYISEWIDQSRIYYIQEEPYAILGYYDEDGSTELGQLSTVVEPDASVTEDDPITLTFYYYGAMPDHDYIVLDEFSTASMEMDQGDEYVYGYVSSALAGAEFSLTTEDGLTAYFEEETINLTDEDGNSTGLTKHIYLFEGWADSIESVPEGYTTVLVSDTTGFINIEGLDTGTYIVTEIAAPDGYNLLDGTISVTIEATYDETTGALLTHTVSYTYNGETSNGVVYVLNSSGTELPGTGGIGTTWFYIIGAILVCGAVVVLVTRRRVNAKAA